MCHKDLPPTDDLCERYTLVLLPVLDSLLRVYKDDEVVVLALKMDLRGAGVSLHRDFWWRI